MDNIHEDVNPPQSPIQSQSSANFPNKSGAKIPTILALLILLLIFGGGIYYSRMKKTTPKARNENVNTPSITSAQNNALTNTPTATQTPQNDETINWKSYSSGVLSFKYPKTLTLQERQKNYIVLLSNANNPQSVLVSIDARQSGSYANYENAISSVRSGLTNVQTKDITNGVKISGIIGPGYGQGQQVTVVIFKYGTASIEAETTTTDQSQLQTFNTIVSTFKFTK